MLVKLLAMVLAARAGFTHVSDDDYSRTVIAESFAHAPRLDPSGTSWLPLPFWIAGTSMMAFGRSLAVAQTTAWCLGALGALPPFLALRYLGYDRLSSWLAAVLAALAPWSLWLASATVPEGWSASLTATGLLLLASDRPRAPIAAALMLLVAALSRYEAWPACAVATVVFSSRAARSAGRERGWLVVGAVVSALAPIMWMAWNRHAHGSALSFFARVSAFKRLSESGPRSFADRLLEFPAALATQFPEAVGGALLAVICSRRVAWGVPLLGAGAVVLFLVAGDLSGGAPTHHPERALCAVAIVTTTLGVVAAAARARALIPTTWTRAALAALMASAWCGWVGVRLFDPPGRGEGEDRSSQIARGNELRADDRALVVTPCQYEHYALIAALGAPERVTIGPLMHTPVTDACPEVRER